MRYDITARTSWVFSLDLGPKAGSLMAVLYVLVLRADKVTRECWPSLKVLAKNSGLSISSVKRMVKELVERGLVEVEKREEGYTVYSLNMTAGGADEGGGGEDYEKLLSAVGPKGPSSERI